MFSSETILPNLTSIYAKFCTDLKNMAPRTILVSDWLKHKQILSFETAWPNRTIIYRNHLCGFFTQFALVLHQTAKKHGCNGRFLFLLGCNIYKLFSETALSYGTIYIFQGSYMQSYKSLLNLCT